MAKTDMERRALAPFELRAEGDMIKVVGHAAVFNQETDIAGFFREVIRPGAFTRAIREDDVPFLIEHDDLPLARSTGGKGTLRLSEDAIGLRIEADLDPTDPDVMRIVPKMKRGDLSKMSFAFRVPRDGEKWTEEEGKTPLREITDARLFDVAIVTSPAYEGTDIALRSLHAKMDAEAKAATEQDDAERRRKAAELRVKRLKRIPDLKHRESALASAMRRLPA